MTVRHEHEHEHEHSGGERGVLRELAADGGGLERGAGIGKILYLDAPSGVAGDMLVAALLDLGVPESVVLGGLSGLGLDGYSVLVSRVWRSSIAGKYFFVDVQRAQPSRDYAAIVSLLHAAGSLTDGARALALRAFLILARAEARVHDCAIESVHFHEVGAVDSIVDITAAAIALDHLGARVVCSPLPLGRGSTRSAHGTIPLPAPATVLCLTGVPTYDPGVAAELVTPTGASLVAAAAESFGAWPTFCPEHVGMGAGTKDWPDRANVLRAVLGSPEPALGLGRSQGLHVVVEANVDDTSPEIAAFALQRALDAGALDAWSTPVGMKKGRSAVTLSVLCRREQLEVLSKLLLSETTTLGVRYYPVDRLERPRRMVRVETQYGPIDLKVASGDGLDEHAAPEYEACRQVAEVHGVPIRRVYAVALAAFEAQRPKT